MRGFESAGGCRTETKKKRTSRVPVGIVQEWEPVVLNGLYTKYNAKTKVRKHMKTTIELMRNYAYNGNTKEEEKDEGE